MKTLLIVLSAGVLAGLLVYAALDAFEALGLMGNMVTIRISTFVTMIAAVGFGAAALALVIRRAVDREDQGLVRRFEDRLARLEAQPK